MSNPPALTRLQKLLLVLIVMLGFSLRFGGLDHDLHEEVQYHPDTPKQIRAVERFLDGRYYYHTGILDYDIYPYFHAHLLEYLCRAGDALHGGWQALVGVPVTPWQPDYYQLFWLALTWNALLATLLILIVFRLVWENWDARAALAAALLLAVSPMDTIACHFAGADTTAGFFATQTVFFALRIYRLGRARDYALAALFVACGFSSKYHAGLALLPVLTAHVLRAGSWRALVGRAALGRLVLLALVGIPATLLTTPILLTHFSEALQNIVGFFSQVTNHRLADEGSHSRALTTLSFALRHTLPLFVKILGPLICFGLLLGLKNVFRRRPDPRAAVLYTLPLVYFVLGGGLRPTAHPIVQTLMTPLLFAAAAVVFTRPFGRPENDHPVAAGLRWLVVVLSAALLLNTSAREVFLFGHQDTRRLALAWTEENVPAAFAVPTDRYAFTSGKFAADSNAVGRIRAAAGDATEPPPAQRLKTFAVETDGLPVHRNIPVHLYLTPSAWLQPGFRTPVFQRWPSENGNRVICDNGPELLRSEKLLVLEPSDRPAVRWLVSTAPLATAWLAVRNGNTANLVTLAFGDTRRSVSLQPGEIAWWPAPARPAWPSDAQHAWYRWSAQAFYGRARVQLATRTEEIGAFLYHAGRYAEALPLLTAAAAETRHPTLAALALDAAARASQALPSATRAGLEHHAAPLATVTNAERLRAVFGIGLPYLEALDFVALEAETLPAAGCPVIVDADAAGGLAVEKYAATPAMTNPPPMVMTPFLQLDPGAYTCTLRVRGTDPTIQPTPWRLAIRDLFGATLATQSVELPPLDDRRYTNVTVKFRMPPAAPEARLFLEPQSPAGVVLDNLQIKPDLLATLAGLASPAPSAPAPAAPAEAGTFTQPVNALLDGGLRIVSLSCRRAAVPRGRMLDVYVELQLEQPGLNLANHAVFIHGIDAAGNIVFQGDFGVADLLHVFAPRYAAPRSFYRSLPIPAGAAPGAYRLRIGVCRLDTGARLKVKACPLEQKSKAVLLAQPVRVTD